MPLLVVAVTLALAWLFLERLPRSRSALTAILVAGLFVAVEDLSLLLEFPVWLRFTVVGRFRYDMLRFGSQSTLYYLACGWIVIGLVGFFRRQAEADKVNEP